MNLFADEVKELIKKYMTEDWAEALSIWLPSYVFEETKEKVGYLRRTTTIYPESKDVFRSLNYSFEDIKVIIVGQDPYHNGNADGLAFSCKQSLSPSLQKMLQAIWKDEARAVDQPIATQANMNYYMGNTNNIKLDYLAEQGVFLYNPSLTVEKGFPGSHRTVWIDFSRAVLQTVNAKQSPVVWLVWGGEAKKAVDNATPIKNPGHLFLYATHPAAAAHQQASWSCDHFYKANQWLEQKGLTKIKWLR